jgi:hypothetical protein
MADPEVWALMQRVEAFRYHAERVERAGAHWPTPRNDLASDSALQWRQLAGQICALSVERASEAVSPSRWT